MRQYRLSVLLFSLAAGSIASSCSSDPIAPAIEPVRDFQTDSAHYTLVGDNSYNANIGVTFINRTTQSVTFVNCNGLVVFHLEKLINNEWVGALFPLFPDCLSTPIIVPVDGRHSMSFQLVAALPGANAAPKFAVAEIPGTYRVVWDDGSAYSPLNVRFGDEFGDPLPLDHRISNSFTLSLKK